MANSLMPLSRAEVERPVTERERRQTPDLERSEVETVLLENLKDDLLRPEAVAFAIEEFGRQLRSGLTSLSGDIAEMRSRKEKLESEIRNLTKATAEVGSLQVHP